MCGTDQAAVKAGKSNCKCRCICDAVSSARAPTETLRLNPRPTLSPDSVVNLDHGDPKMFEPYWAKVGDACTVEIAGSEAMSYFSDAGSLCWFLEAELAEAIRSLHRTVGNALVEGHHVVVGTGSTQLFQAALYALSPQDGANPVSVVSELPYYSSYPEVTDFLRSGLYRWAGDARALDEDGPYIELVTSPNNPDGSIREPVVANRGGRGRLVYDLAYYWPQYTPITEPLEHDLMLFTVSKCTGHAGSRVGWALVKDEEVARRMIKFIELSTIGVSKESQLRAAKILQEINRSYRQDLKVEANDRRLENFFEYGQRIMSERWTRLREVVGRTQTFSLPDYPVEYCRFAGHFAQAHPAFAWLKCNKEETDCAGIFREQKILTRTGMRFGVDETYARVSMLDRDEAFNLFLERLSAMV